MRDFTKLSIWQRSHKLCLKIYSVTQVFPKEEMFGLTNQMRRSSPSVPTNIAEGCGSHSNAQTNRFFDIAIASLTELQYQCILSYDLNYIDQNTFKELHDETV